MSNTGQAWVTLATNDSYALGALVLAQSLKRNNTIHQLAILITPGVSSAMREVLSSTFDLIKEVDVLDSRDAANLALLARPDLGITFTKLHCWNLTQYTKCVFLDADTLVVKNCDELFERDELSAAPDAGWPDCFNSGVFVFTPSEATFKSLLEFALTNGSFDGGDQGLLNTYFGDWATKDITKHLPFVYNMVASATYSYLPAFKAYGGNVKIAHFIGGTKPWLQTLPGGSTLSSFLDLWWDIFLKDVSKKLNTNMGGLAGALAGGQKDIIEDQWRKQSWEQGNIDYMGKDAFENIWKKIAETVGEDIKPLEAPVPVVPLEAPVPVVPLEAPVPVVPSAQEESALAPATEAPKTEDKTDSPNVDIEKDSEQPVEKPQTKVEEGRADQPQPEGVKPETTPEISPVVEPATLPKPDIPPEVPSADTKKEETPKAEPLVPTAEEAQVPAVKPEDTPKQSTDAPLVAQTAPPLQSDPIEPAVTKSEPVQPAEVVPATEQPSVPIQPVVPAPSTDELVPQAPTETVPKDQSPPTVAPQRTSPPKTAIEVPPSPEIPEPAKDPKTPTTLPADKKGPSPPKDDPKPPEPPKEDSKPPESPKDEAKPPEPPKDDAKPPEPPKDGGAEKVATPVQEPIAPTSPTLPGPASPSAPEGTKVDSVQPPISPEPQAPSGTETSTPPQTPTGDAPVPPKRSSKKGKAKK